MLYTCRDIHIETSDEAEYISFYFNVGAPLAQ